MIGWSGENPLCDWLIKERAGTKAKGRESRRAGSQELNNDWFLSRPLISSSSLGAGQKAEVGRGVRCCGRGDEVRDGRGEVPGAR